MIRRTATTAAMLATLALAATGCAGDDQPEAIPPASSTPTATTPPPSPTPTTPAWQASYTPDELAAYQDALQRFESYESRSEPIWATGQATRAAEVLFSDYFIDAVAARYIDQLTILESVDVQTTGTPSVYWSKVQRITPSGEFVVIRQCVNYESVTSVQRGQVAPRDSKFTGPLLRDIEMVKTDPGSPWRISSFESPSDGRARACDTSL